MVFWTSFRSSSRTGTACRSGTQAPAYEQAVAGIAAGARHATHLFNRMSAFTHRAPGLCGAILDSDQVAAEIICDGVHVHPAAVRFAVAAKGRAPDDGDHRRNRWFRTPARRPRDARRPPISVGDAAYLADGTLAGSVLTMDLAFSALVKDDGLFAGRCLADVLDNAVR